MKISILGAGAWGTTLAQVLADNNHNSLIYDVNMDNINKINNNIHPSFNIPLSNKIKATNKLEDIVNYSKYILISLPSKTIRYVLKDLSKYLKKPIIIINASKGIEPKTAKRVSEICKEEIPSNLLKGYCLLTGPSHAEEVVLRKITLLTSASNDEKLAKKVQKIFSNKEYVRIYTNKDLIGCEVSGAVKNAIAIVSGIMTELDFGENARAALITRGAVEIVRIVTKMGGNKETVFGLTGIGDLIVTVSSEKSRNFRAGKLLAKGIALDKVLKTIGQTVEGIRTINALYDYSKKENLYLPIINTAYEFLHNNLELKEAISKLLTSELKSEKFF